MTMTVTEQIATQFFDLASLLTNQQQIQTSNITDTEMEVDYLT